MLVNWCMWKIFYDIVNNKVMYYICYKKKKQKKKLTHLCTEKMVYFIVIHVCFSNIDSAFFECLPWSTGVDIQFVIG